jgi:O-antigen/teichoic acid export membrane protein
VLVNVVTGLLVARLLGPEGRGSLAAIVFWPQFLASLVLAGLPYSVIFHLRATPAARREIFTAGLALAAGLGCLGMLAGIVIVPVAMSHGYPPAVVAFAQLGVGFTIVNLLAMLLKSSLCALDRQGLANRFGLADPVLYLVLLLVAAALVPLTPQIAAACLFGGATVTLCAVLYRLRAGRPSDLGGLRRWLGRIGGYALRAAPGGLLSNLSYHLDRLILVALITPRELGLYAVAFSLSRLMEVVKTTVGSVGMAAMAGRAPAEAKALHDRVLRFVLYAVLGIVAGGWALGGPAITLVYGPDFAAANDFFRVLVVEAALACLGQVVAQLYFSLGRPSQVSIAQAASFVVSLLAMLLLVPGLGALGVAIGLTLGTLLRLCVLVAGVRLVLGMGLPRLVPEPGEFGLFWRHLTRA